VLRFFRQIRQKLFPIAIGTDTNFSKYLLYAVGEILLVVIGILIALQVNNWNEERNRTQTEIEYLKRLRSDLANDTAYYHRRINYSNKVIEDHKKAIMASYTQISNPRDFYQSFKNIEYSSEALSLRDITYNEMHNAGQINIIRNDEIKTELMEFYRQVDLVAKHFDEINTTSIEFMKDFLIRSNAYKYWSYGLESMPWTAEMVDASDDWQWINDPDSESFKSFQLSLSFYSTKQNIFKGYFEDLENKSTFIIQEIENELKNRSIKVPELTIEPVFVLE
jgi:hypothetical protein